MNKSSYVLGIDVGSVSISVVAVDRHRNVVQHAYEFHQGRILTCLNNILSNFALSGICGIASTASTPSILKVSQSFDNRVALIEACRLFHDEIGSILLVGGEKFGLIQFDANGNYHRYKANTSCAAGTGSFLDQQAQRLSLKDAAALSQIAMKNTGTIPKIASRCAVFAKTDLVHAQQEGYLLEQICDGLCLGLAKNIVDTLFGGRMPPDPIIFTGGVARNLAVVRHLQALTGKTIIAKDTYLYGAVGAALHYWDGLDKSRTFPQPVFSGSVEELLNFETPEKTYAFAPIELRYSVYPDFDGTERYAFNGDNPGSANPVEVDLYREIHSNEPLRVYLGLDIGSTSTKAVLTSCPGDILAGFYTRTAGRPVEATQSILAAIQDLAVKKQIEFQIGGAATTGSGRKFSGKIIGADVIIDEISAHARAAVELNPKVDTIIEIGGQDSKFTTLQNGEITFCAMNTVCAAGTGSFIEEQARRLGCRLSEYSARTEGRRSPMASDRCTVFMERDINHYLNLGYSVDEALTAGLHSIRENYLTKVAVESSIGQTVFFQGATAKNRALVAAFEQKLKKPIHVSKFCHLTGALGAALALVDERVTETRFRGLDLCKKQIPIRSQVCELCTNHCKISIARVDDQPVAFGFLCGRDYDTHKRVNNNRSGFDLLKARKKAFELKPRAPASNSPTIGIPAALNLFEDLALWQKFFDHLQINTLTSESFKDAIAVGKHVAGAEFCAPMGALHGHVHHLLAELNNVDNPQKPDYLFLPVYLEQKPAKKGLRRQYCYYTQYATGLAAGLGNALSRQKILRPLVNYLYNQFYTKAQLYKMLKSISSGRFRFMQVSEAYDQGLAFKKDGLDRLKHLYRQHTQNLSDIHVVLLGRPYTIVDKSMNKGIVDIFASMGIKTFFQDMVSYTPEDVAPIKSLLDELHWHYAAEILAVAEIVAQSRGAYPVLVSSFKCTPDSFVMDYFKKVMASHDKPYLILQLDEHSSSVGYETRIEAGIRSFRNHFFNAGKNKIPTYDPALQPVKEKQLANKTLILPNWDRLSLRLVVANLRRAGIDARLLEENPISIRKSLRHNNGQCLPLNIVAQEFIDFVQAHNLDPGRTVLWIAESNIACNIRLYPHHIKTLLHSYGKGFQKAGVYVGGTSLVDISLKLPINTYFAYMFGGYLRKLGCRIRPYEKTKGTTDAVIEKSLDILAEAFAGQRTKDEALTDVISLFNAIETRNSRESSQRPKVAIFGDLYARDNPTINQDLIHFIELHGGEVVTTPYSSYAKMIARPYLRKWFVEGYYLQALSSKALLTEMVRREKPYLRRFNQILNEPEARYDDPPEEILAAFNLRIENTGESMDNLLKIYYLLKFYPEISLFVQTSPAFCCPALVTEAMARQIEHNTGVPMVAITYDGTGGNKNEIVIPYLAYPRASLDKDDLRFSG
jgi:predicted CoA-substrate-specific enzyme activase